MGVHAWGQLHWLQELRPRPAALLLAAVDAACCSAVLGRGQRQSGYELTWRSLSFSGLGDGGVTGFRWYFLAQLRGAGERAAVAAGPSGLLHGIRFRCGGLKQK